MFFFYFLFFILYSLYFYFIYLKIFFNLNRDHKKGVAEEVEAISLMSRESNAGLDLRTVGSWAELKADT